MYGYTQGNYGGYGSYVNGYGGLGQNAAPPTALQSNVFGSSTNSPYANYGNSLMGAYGYNQQSTAGGVSAYNPAQHVSRGVIDAYATSAAMNHNYGMPVIGNSTAGPVGYGRGCPGGSSMTPGSKAAFSTNFGFSPKPKPPSSAQYTGVGPSAYETAVYAAASSLFQAKAVGTPNMWKKQSGMGRGGGGQGFGAKRNYQTKDAQQFFCETCKISCAGQLTYKEHLEGQKHKKKEALAKGENSQSLPKTKVSFRCDLCNVTCTGQDTYNAHVRGTKHQKTLTLCKKLGKPIPANEPTIIPPSDLGGKVPPPPPIGMNIPTVGISNPKRVVGISTVNFVQSSKLNSTGAVESKKNEKKTEKNDSTASAISAQSEELQALIAAEQSVLPVGENYIVGEKDSNGKLIQYVCSLCECKFSDPNAKEIHLKGRKHRLQYKLKVDPSLEVEFKAPTARRGGRFGGPALALPKGGLPAMGKPAWFGPVMDRRTWSSPLLCNRPTESFEEKYLQAKHILIYPEDDYLATATEVIDNIEDTLKKVSNKLQSDSTGSQQPIDSNSRLLQGVMRVGLVSNHLLLQSDTQLDLVVVCSKIPTRGLLNEVSQLFQSLYESTSSKDEGLTVSVVDSAILLTFTGCHLTFHVSLTSRAFREDSGEPLPADSLDKEACLLALAQLRHSNWYQARCAYLQSCSQTLRILRDVRMRNPAWQPLSDWMCELLVEKVLSSCPLPLSASDAFRRVIEAVASGILSPIGPGLPDPCEKDTPDALLALTSQQREDIMQNGQHFLRLICFNQIHKVLGMERLVDSRPSTDRKRPFCDKNSGDEVKKDKKEDYENHQIVVKMEA